MKKINFFLRTIIFSLLLTEKICALEIQSAIEEKHLPTPAKAEGRPSVALVLSGGGARGFAHLPVIELLEEEGIPIDIIIGNSAGSIAGAFYCAGYRPDEIFSLMNEFALGEILNDSPPNPSEFFLKEHSSYSSIFQIGSPNSGGIASGQSIYELFRRLTIRFPSNLNFDNLQIPFRAITVNLLTGKVEVQNKGDLAEALRCSMSVPGMFAPFEKDGSYYIDGMARDDTPIDVALKMGYDIVIVSNLSDPLKSDPAEFENSITATIFQMLNMEQYSRKSNNEQLATLSLYPDCGGESMLAYSKGQHIYDSSKKSMEGYREKVKELKEKFFSEPPTKKEIKKYTANPYQKAKSIKITGGSANDEELIQELAQKYLQEDFTEKSFAALSQALYRSGRYKSTVIRLEEDEDNKGDGTLHFIVHRQKKKYNQILFSPTLYTSVSDDYSTAFSLALEYQMRGLTGYGSILAFELSAVNKTGLCLFLKQPFGTHAFTQSQASYFEFSNESRDGWNSIESSIANRKEISFVQDAGLSLTGEKSIFYLQGAVNFFDNKGLFRDHVSFSTLDLSANFKLSTLDSLAFPSKGLMANFSVAGIFPLSKEERDKEFFFDKLEAFVTVAIPFGKKFSLALDIKAGGSVSESLNSLPEMKMPYAFSQKDRLFFSNVASINPLATNMACSAASLYFFPQTSLSMAGIKCMTGFSAAQGFFWDNREDMQSGKGVWRVSLDAGIQFKKNSALLLRVGGGFVQEKVSPFVSLDLGAFRM